MIVGFVYSLLTVTREKANACSPWTSCICDVCARLSIKIFGGNLSKRNMVLEEEEYGFRGT